MWPTLVRKIKQSVRPKARAQSDLLAEAALDQGGPRQTDIPQSSALSGGTSLFDDSEGGMEERELEALEAWLDADADAPWISTTSEPPVITVQPSGLHGFEDDFADFVSATATTPRLSAERLTGDEEDEALPSQQEIANTARRIFGTSATLGPEGPLSSDGGVEDDGDPFNFDLGEVLGALQSMKEEVSGIQDPVARRRAAARVALGFAAGLGLPADAHPSEE